MVIKNRTIFHLLSCTWGVLMTAIGAVVALTLLITGHKPKMYGHCIHFETGKNWGGISLGLFFFTSTSAASYARVIAETVMLFGHI